MAENRLLIVDDEVDFLTIMKKRIESWGYEVVSASNAQDALAIVRGTRPDAIILDYMMPEINGIDLLRKIREIDRGVPVIMFTANPTFKAIKDGQGLRVAAFIPKVSALNDVEKDLEMTLGLILPKK